MLAAFTARAARSSSLEKVRRSARVYVRTGGLGELVEPDLEWEAARDPDEILAGRAGATDDWRWLPEH